MTRTRHDRRSTGRLMAERVGPELVALVLTILVVLAIAVALRVGPFAADTAPDPSSPNEASPATSRATQLERPGAGAAMVLRIELERA